MNFTLTFNSPLQSIFWPKENTFLKETFLVIGSVLLLALAAHISIPLQPVPLTFQSAAVVSIGMILGARLGTYSLLAYLIAGFSGLPVFADTDSNFIFGPTMGYRFGFLPAVLVCGYLAQKGFAKNVIGSFLASAIGISIIFLFGLLGLSFFVSWQNAIAYGLLPFVISEPLKLLAVSLAIPRFWKIK